MRVEEINLITNDIPDQEDEIPGGSDKIPIEVPRLVPRGLTSPGGGMT